ncbi:hypothetical protein QL285_077660 [Trifolium repens]|nr:hypothetical protein QL285_077660 [Trifolium repens]
MPRRCCREINSSGTRRFFSSPTEQHRNRIWASVLALIVCKVRMKLMWPIVRKMQDHVWSQDTIAKFADFNDDEGGLVIQISGFCYLVGFSCKLWHQFID